VRLVRSENGIKGNFATIVPEKKEPKDDKAAIMKTAIKTVDFILKELIS